MFTGGPSLLNQLLGPRSSRCRPFSELGEILDRQEAGGRIVCHAAPKRSAGGKFCRGRQRAVDQIVTAEVNGRRRDPFADRSSCPLERHCWAGREWVDDPIDPHKPNNLSVSSLRSSFKIGGKMPLGEGSFLPYRYPRRLLLKQH